MIKAIIFDLDGVLISTDELHYRAWKALADRLGVPFDRAQNDRCRGISRMDSLEIVLERSPVKYTLREKEAFAAEKTENYRSMLGVMTESDVPEGVLPTLALLKKRGYSLALASASKNAPLILERTGLGCISRRDGRRELRHTLKTRPGSFPGRGGKARHSSGRVRRGGRRSRRG